MRVERQNPQVPIEGMTRASSDCLKGLGKRGRRWASGDGVSVKPKEVMIARAGRKRETCSASSAPDIVDMR